jgi:hypothetical protein
MASLDRDDPYRGSPPWESRGVTERRAWAAAEATVEARVRRELAEDPFEALMRHYDEGQRVEVYVGEGGYRYVETPEFFAYADDVRRAALSVCKTLALTPSTSLPETKEQP